MKITCQSCQSKYTIADEKVVGKIVKIKCKKCGSTIVVNGNEVASAAAPAGVGPGIQAASPADGDDDEGATRIFTGDPGAGAPAGGEWTVSVADDDQRTMTTPQILVEIRNGVVTGDTYVWKDGMADWLPVSEVPELKAGLPAAAAVPPQGLGGTVVMNEPSPFAGSPQPAPAAPPQPAAAAAPIAAAPAAARKAGGRGAGVDLFGGGGAAAAAAPAPAAPDHSRSVGERNENSVLFSLSALTAAENAAKVSPAKADDAAIMRPAGGPPPPRNGGRGNIDDIMNLGGGGIGGGGLGTAALAPPPLLAPVVEAPPPPPPSVAAAPAMGPSMGMGAPMSFAPPQKKSPVGLIVGIVGALAIGGVAVWFLALRPKPPENTPTTENTATTAATATETAAPANTAAAAPTDTGASSPSAAPSAAVAAGTGHGPTTGPGTKEPGTKPSATPSAAPTAAPVPTAAPTATAVADSSGGGGAEFNRGAATSALSAAAGSAKGCKKADGPTGSAKVRVTFAPSGNVTSANVEGPPFAGTSVGGCIAAAFRGAHVPPFDGSPVSVSKTVTIN